MACNDGRSAPGQLLAAAAKQFSSAVFFGFHQILAAPLPHHAPDTSASDG